MPTDQSAPTGSQTPFESNMRKFIPAFLALAPVYLAVGAVTSALEAKRKGEDVLSTVAKDTVKRTLSLPRKFALGAAGCGVWTALNRKDTEAGV